MRKSFYLILIASTIFILIHSIDHIFYYNLISGPLFTTTSDPLGPSEEAALLQPYHYLSQGRQAFAFASFDEHWVIKFFNQKYHQVPFYALWNAKEKSKRELRKRFYLESYKIAGDRSRQETGICYLHLGPSSCRLPVLSVKDRLGLTHHIDLNQVPFILQKKADPFYPILASLDDQKLQQALYQFLSLIAARVKEGIGDADHDIEHNFGFCNGQIIQIDPGRLYLEKQPFDIHRMKKQWWSSTHRLRIWLQKHRPESLQFFDRTSEKFLEEVCTIDLFRNKERKMH